MTEIRRTVYAVLLPHMLQRERPVFVKDISRHGPVRRLQQIGKVLFMMNPAAEIQLPKMAVLQYGHNIADLFIVQVKCFRFLVE